MSALTQILLAALAAVWVLPFACVAALIVLDKFRDHTHNDELGDDGLNILNPPTTVHPITTAPSFDRIAALIAANEAARADWDDPTTWKDNR